MKDSTGMTIEFLRAQLLSERSVTRTARQRADELAKRVVELEEQLKIVSLQRKKAERATSDVLSILVNHGISDVSEEFDSSSEQEITHGESKVGNNFPKEESSFGLKMRRNDMNEVSGSELESSPLSCRSLSWKSGKDSTHSHEKKHVDSSTRRQRTFASATSASLKRRVGKSCRRIQRRDTRSTVEESQIDSSMLVHQDNGVATCSEGSSTFSDIGPKNLRESSEMKDAEIEPEAPISGDFENQRSVTNASNYLNSHGSDKDMERALEHQAQLIGQYEEEEKAQREWEEKFRENNNRTQDLCDPGNRSDVTEERNEANKAHAPPYPVATMASKDQDAKLVVEDVCIAKVSSKSQSDGFQSPPRVDIGFLQDKKSNGMLAYESPASDFVFPVATEKQDRQHSGDYGVLPLHSYHPPLYSEGPAGNQSARAGSSLRKEDTPGSKNEHYALITRETPDNLGSVLEALHHAKLSLKQKLNALPSIDGGSVGKALEYSVGERQGVPVGCAGLFRVPSDYHIEATGKVNVLGSNSRLSFTNSYPEAGSALTAGDRFINRPYTTTSSSVSTGDRHLINPTSVHMESRSNIPNWEPMRTWPRFSSHKQFFGPSLETVLPFPSRFTYSDPTLDMGLASSRTYYSPTSPFYADVMPRIASTEGLRPFLNGGTGVPPASQFSFDDNHLRPNMYRL